MGLETLALISAVATVGGTVMSHTSQRKAEKAQQQQQAAAARKERMQAIRQAQIQRAQAVMSSVGQGSSESSGAAGGIGSISSQLGTEQGFGSQMTSLSSDISRHSSRAGMWGAVANIGATGFQTFGGGDWLKGKMSGASAAPYFPGYNDPRPRRNPAY